MPKSKHKIKKLFLHGDLKIFTSAEEDWFCVANKEDDHIHLLYEGHNRDQAYESIFEEIDLKLSFVTKDMSAGSFVPKEEDWE